MNPAGDHDHAYAELVFLYAVRALPPAEAAAVDAHLAACADCQQEL
jgi:anti-sigma factor RsiW